jgi:metacaspase-1
MPDKISVLCVHGIGHGDEDALLVPSWTQAITENLQRWNPVVALRCDFLPYDELFDHAPLNPVTYGEAVAKLLASGVIHGIGDLFPGSRGLFDLPEQIRWTAGMIAQWSSEDGLRAALRNRILSQMNATGYDVVCAHSLGSLVCYDTFRRNAELIKNKIFVTLGSQIGNPFVRDCFAGRIEPLEARMWYHLFNSDDHVFTAQLRVTAANFVQIIAQFDKPDDVLNHDPIWYFNHANTRARVWFDISGTGRAREIKSKLASVPVVVAPPERRALLIGINAYANPANRLEGCINDTFLMSSVLQESGFLPEEIRVVLDERATTAGILERLHWLLDDVRGGDERVLFFSGHGAQIPAYGARQEVDHLDECLVPYDFDWSIERAITDKQFVQFYSQLPYDARFVAIFDCCHSGGLSRDGGLRARGLNPPDDVRHRALRWNASFGMWEEREIQPPNRSLARSEEGKRYLGTQGVSYRLGRGVSLRTLPNQKYDRERKALGHLGAYLPIIFEACQEQELSYEYRDGANSYGAFTFCLAKVLREVRAKGNNPNFSSLTRLAAARLRALGYQQTPALLGPHAILRKPIPWTRPRSRRK